MRSRLAPRVRQGTIITHLRNSIVRGTPPPGSRLPTRLEMAKQFRTTVVTVQRALDHLAADGFVTANGRSGTYVAPHPPHLSHYGLVFSYRPNEPESWSGLARAVRDAAFAIERTESRRLSFYFHTGYEPHKTEDFERLVEGVHSQTLAGLIFVESPHRLLSTPVIEVPGIPRIAMMSEAVIPGVAAAHLDGKGFFEQALDYLRRRGRKRVAIVSGRYNKAWREFVTSIVVKRGMELRPYWWQSANPDPSDWAINATHLLLNDRQHERPDALIIADEVLVESASLGIAAAGVRVGQDIDVVSHCNFPRAGMSVLPYTWLGFDINQLLHGCFDYIDKSRRGASVGQQISIGPRFEQETNDPLDVRAAKSGRLPLRGRRSTERQQTNLPARS